MEDQRPASQGIFQPDPRGRLYFLSSLTEGAPQGDSMRLISLKKQGRPALLESAPGSTPGGCFFRLPPESGGQSVADVSNMAWRRVALFCHSGYWAYFKE